VDDDQQPVLYLVVCGAPPAAEVEPFVVACQAIGWDLCVVPTRIGRRFLDTGRLVKLTGHPLRDDYKFPHEEDVLPPADALVVAPATFNTVNKLAVGVSDTVALGLLNEAIGSGTPVVVAVRTSEGLAAHPAFDRHVEALRSYGVRLLPHTIGNDAPFPWDDLREVAAELHASLAPSPAGEP